jgi:hypothetical protein
MFLLPRSRLLLQQRGSLMSLPTPPDRNDYGIVFYGTALGGDSYVDILGKTRQAVQLQSGTEVFMDQAIESAYFHVGNATSFSLEVQVQLHSGDSLVLALHGELEDGAVDSSSPVLQTMRNDTGVAGGTQTFSAAGNVMLQTSNLADMFTATIGVSGTIAGIEGTSIIVYLRAVR